MGMDKTTLLQRQTDVQTKFDDLTKQIADLDNQVIPIKEEQARLQGEHRLLTELINGFVDTPPEQPGESVTLNETVPSNETVPVEGEVVTEPTA